MSIRRTEAEEAGRGTILPEAGLDDLQREPGWSIQRQVGKGVLEVAPI